MPPPFDFVTWLATNVVAPVIVQLVMLILPPRE